MEPTQPLPRRRVFRWLHGIAAVLWLLVALLLVVGTLLLRGSLPTLAGTRMLAGLHAPVTVWRDAAGRTLVLHWSEYDPTTMSIDLVEMLDARTVDDALDVAHRTGEGART